MNEGIVLLTGFRRFGPHAVNPSEDIVRRLTSQPTEDVRLATAVLPVEYANAFAPVREAIERLRPAAVLHLGLAADRAEPQFERVAANWRGAAGPDEAGVTLTGEPIDPDGPPALDSTAPVEALVAACRSAGLAAGASSDAGRFLCNQVLYQTLRHAARTGTPRRAVFLHLPRPAPDGASGATLDDLTRVVTVALRVLASLPCV